MSVENCTSSLEESARDKSFGAFLPTTVKDSEDLWRKYWRRLCYTIFMDPAWKKILCYSFILLSVTSCGKGYDNDDDNEIQREEISELYGMTLNPLNTRTGKYSGWGSISNIENQFWAKIRIEGPRSEIEHAQYMHTGSRCPTMADDTNGDGYLDFMEAHEVVGDILIPLDATLTSQMSGLNIFPKIKKNGFYFYSEAANYEWLIQDLHARDGFPFDMITKLGRNEPLALETRVVMIYGVSENSVLPESVETYDAYPKQFSLPVACGRVMVNTEDQFHTDPQ